MTHPIDSFAVVTRHIGTEIVATADPFYKIAVPYDDDLPPEQNHLTGALAIAKKLSLPAPRASAYIPGSGEAQIVHIFTSTRTTQIIRRKDRTK